MIAFDLSRNQNECGSQEAALSPNPPPKATLLLSPANAAGSRATRRERNARFETWACAGKSEGGAPLGEDLVISGPIFSRQRLAYAQRFVKSTNGIPGPLSSNRLRRPDSPETLDHGSNEELAGFSAAFNQRTGNAATASRSKSDARAIAKMPDQNDKWFCSAACHATKTSSRC